MKQFNKDLPELQGVLENFIKGKLKLILKKALSQVKI